jgi:hypothetical protein
MDKRTKEDVNKLRKTGKFTEEFLMKNVRYLNAYYACFRGFTESYSHEEFQPLQDEFHDSLVDLQSDTEQYELLLQEQRKENKPANPFFS